ncbi:MAG: hypothetical protein JO257_33860 [Deltaproteobacteria bacterium]|nr:hypothetical protein [Deltaproteobacteria bacterium]
MNVADLDEVQYDLEQDGMQVREQLARRVWEKAGWATVAITFRERDKDGEWKAPKLALLRFRRLDEMWKKQALITLSADDARDLGAFVRESFTAST